MANNDLSGVLARLEGRIGNLEANGQAMADHLAQIQVSEDVTEDWLQIPYRFENVESQATAILTRTIAGDGPFDLIEITYTSEDEQGAVNNDWRIRIREGESVGRTLTQDGAFIDIDNTAGTAQRPYIIKGRRRYRANIAIVVEITNVGAATGTLEVTLHGIKVFTR
jgi:hypothetical protein